MCRLAFTKRLREQPAFAIGDVIASHRDAVAKKDNAVNAAQHCCRPDGGGGIRTFLRPTHGKACRQKER